MFLEGEQWMGTESEAVRMRRGDPDAFDALLARYQNRLYRYLLRLTANPAVAQDLFQETWLKVITRIHSYDERRPFEPWLFSVARNLSIDHLRRGSPESLDEPAEGGETRASRLSADEPGPLERLLDGERHGLLERRLEELPAVYREALSLRFEEEMTFEEIAEVLSAPLHGEIPRAEGALDAQKEDGVRERELDEELEVLALALRRLRTPMPPEALVSRVRRLAHLELAMQADERISRLVMAFLLAFSWTITLFAFLAVGLLSGEDLLGSVTGSRLSWSVAYLVFTWISGVALLVVLGFHARKERRLA